MYGINEILAETPTRRNAIRDLRALSSDARDASTSEQSDRFVYRVSTLDQYSPGLLTVLSLSIYLLYLFLSPSIRCLGGKFKRGLTVITTCYKRFAILSSHGDTPDERTPYIDGLII